MTGRIEPEKSVPTVSRPGKFLEYHSLFFENDHHPAGYEGMLSLIRHIAVKDTGFNQLYAKALKDKKVTKQEMLDLVTEMCRIADELGWFTYRDDAPTDDEPIILPLPTTGA